MRRDILERRAEIIGWIAERRPKAFICRELRCKPVTLEGYLKRMGLEYKGNMGKRGYSQPTWKSAYEYLRKGTTIPSHKLKLKLLRDGLKKRLCERCGNSEWLGEPIPIELHHVNGDRFDNRLVNLQLLCPNCHALTDNHAGKGSRRKFGVYSRQRD
jgi:ribosomal protein S27AE